MTENGEKEVARTEVRIDRLGRKSVMRTKMKDQVFRVRGEDDVRGGLQ